MSWRRFGVILRHLPIESAYMTAVRNATDPDAELPPPEPGIFGPWSQTDMLLARIGDGVSALLWQNGQDPKSPTPPPRPLPRPGVESNVRAICPEALAFLEYKREHRGEDPPDDWTPALAPDRR